MPEIDSLFDEATTAAKHFDPVVLESQITRINNMLTWPNYRSGISRFSTYEEAFLDFVDNRQFSVRLVDGSLLQIYYDTADAAVISARLAIIPQPSRLTLESESADLAPPDPFRSSHLRFDYDSSTTAHSVSHLQVEAVNEMRIPLAFIPRPYAFFDFAVECLFPDSYNEIKGKSYHAPALANSIRQQISCAVDHERMHVSMRHCALRTA